MKTDCPNRIDGSCYSPKSISTTCVLDDPRATGCRIVVQEKANARVVGAPSLPMPHKLQRRLIKPPKQTKLDLPTTAASPFDALLKGT
jgi:hypothetical protein